MGLIPQCPFNTVTNTKKPLYILPTRNGNNHFNVDQCFELKDGRIFTLVNSNYILVYNLLNPTLVDIKIDNSNFDNIEIVKITQLDDGILILYGRSPYIKLFQIESKSYKIIKSIDMSHFLASCHVLECCKLSNGQLAFSLNSEKNSDYYINYVIELIAIFGYDTSTKSLINYYQFSFSGLAIYNILECKNNELLLTRMSFEDKEYTFFNLKEQKSILTIKRKQICEPIKLNENFVLFENLDKIEIINLNDHTIYRTISLAKLGYNYPISCFLKFDDNTLFIGDYAGNIYQFSINWNDTNILNFIEVFRADVSTITVLTKYQRNKLISVSRRNETIKIWDLSLMKNNNNLLENYYY